MKLLKTDHINYIKIALDDLSSGYQSLDASRPWLVKLKKLKKRFTGMFTLSIF
jgi:EAL domain-containing protein (putative c-di-GMP-specific phosphodiesterase class I)